MKKGNLFLSLLLAAAISLSAVSVPVFAEEQTTSAETDAEHPESYYQEIQSNNIKGWPQGAQVEAESAILIDMDTGAILYAKNIDQKQYPASITKIMTTLLALEKGNLSDVVKFSANAVYSIEFNSSHLGLTEGEELTLEQCLYGIMLASANEISNAVAEHIGGDVETFVQMMNDKAAELGCTGTHFVNPHGLHDDNHYVTARDMALISKEAFKNKKFREIVKTVEYSYPETNLVDEVRYFMNHHKMISDEELLYKGCIGGKTGFTDQALNTLVTLAKRGNQRLITVVLKAPGMYAAYGDTKTLLDYGFDSFDNADIEPVNSPEIQITGVEDPAELEKIRTADFRQDPFTIKETTKVTVPQGIEMSSIVKTMDFTANTLSYSYEGQTLGSVPFTYTGQWIEETELPQTESETQTTEAVTEKEDSSVLEGAKGLLKKATGSVGFLYQQMDTFIKENTIIALIVGGVLLLIFVPLLLVSVNRHRKYMNMMKLRHEEMQIRRRLEEEIERKSAAQVEAELRAEALRTQLEEEKKKSRRQEEEIKELEELEGFYLDEEQQEQSDTKAEQETAPEEEYIEVPLEDEK